MKDETGKTAKEKKTAEEKKTVENRKTAGDKRAGLVEKKAWGNLAGYDWRRWLAAVLLVFAAGLLLEFCCNLPLLRARSASGSLEEELLSLDQMETEGFSKTADGLLLTGESGTIRIPLSGRYVGTLHYRWSYEGLLNLTARVGLPNLYGEVRERDVVRVTDRNSGVLSESWLPIHGKAAYVELNVNRAELREAGLSYLDFDSYPLCFTSFSTQTAPRLNGYRLCFFWCALGLFTLLLGFRRMFGGRPELGFLVIALSVGSLLSFSLPANKVSWDEEIHFAQSFWLSNYRTPVSISQPIANEFIAGIDTWPYNQPGGLLEQEAFDRYLNETGDYRNGGILWSTDLNKTIVTGYVGQALFLKAGQLLHLPFSLLFKLGRLGNLLVYCLVIALAIRVTPVGKGMMAFLALMPEPMLLAGVYSYDPTVTAFLYLTFALLLRAMLDPTHQLGWREYGGILLAFFWGCRIKAVYAPLILIGLLIPRERFRSRRERILMKTGFVALCVLLIASFALPFLLAPAAVGDVRGTDTSEVGQMAYVLGQPVAYALILIQNIIKTLPSYLFGEQSLGLLGHQGQVAFPWLLYGGAAAVILIGGQSSCGKRLGKKEKLWIFLAAGAAVVLVWTSMYLVFTTPGNTYIDGVQGRYYLPFLFLVWLVLNPDWVVVRLKNETCYSIVLGLSGGMLLAAYYSSVLTKFCL